MLHALIMAGGGGTRFWPRSRSARPKQFLTLAGDRSLLQQAAERLEGPVAAANTWVMTAERYTDLVRQQLPQVDPARVVGEPAGRDTAPCIALAAALIARTDPDAVMLVSPADHVIEPAEVFRRAARAAVLAVEGQPEALVTFGIPPTYPATGYGYIRRGERVGEFAGVGVHRLASFHEKPPAAAAEQFLAEGGYYWNSGIFAWRAATILAEVRRNKPELAAGVDRIAAAFDGPAWHATLAEVYPHLERISIDYAVMEHARHALVLEAPFGWDDVGSWLAVERMHPQDAAGNTVLATHAGVDTRRCVVVGNPGTLIATVGVHDLIIIQDGDAVLVADRRSEAAVKQLVERLGPDGLAKYL
jgi:mannose-1-phosphate guanylyltransferase